MATINIAANVSGLHAVAAIGCCQLSLESKLMRIPFVAPGVGAAKKIKFIKP
jgi:hypothetical protein